MNPGFVSLLDDICARKAQYAAEEPEIGLWKSHIENFQIRFMSQPQYRRAEADCTRSDTLKVLHREFFVQIFRSFMMWDSRTMEDS
jgi:hypothetical protein